jgi:hypothetical protein
MKKTVGIRRNIGREFASLESDPETGISLSSTAIEGTQNQVLVTDGLPQESTEKSGKMVEQASCERRQGVEVDFENQMQFVEFKSKRTSKSGDISKFNGNRKLRRFGAKLDECTT